MPSRIIDCPRKAAPTPFEISPLRFFVYRTAGGFSRLAETCGAFDLDTLYAHFPMGYTNLWVLRREVLRVGTKLHRYAPEPPSGPNPYSGVGATGRAASTERARDRSYLFGDDDSKLDYHHDRRGTWVLGFETLDEALESLDHPDLGKARRIVVATLLDDIYWH